jgi:hypothetical protein
MRRVITVVAPSQRSAAKSLHGVYRTGQPVLPGRERTAPLWVVAAGRLVREIEVEHHPPTLLAEVSALGGVEEIPAGPVGLAELVASRNETKNPPA